MGIDFYKLLKNIEINFGVGVRVHLGALGGDDLEGALLLDAERLQSLAQSIWADRFGGPGHVFTSKLTDLHRNPSMSTYE